MVKRARSALALWWSSIRGSDVLVAGILVAISLGIGAYLMVRANAAAQLAFARQAQILQAAVTERLSVPQEDLGALSSLLESSGRMTRRQFHVVTEALLRPDPLSRRRGIVYAFEWLPFVSGPERLFQEAEGRAAGLSTFRFWETDPDGKPREAGHRPFYVPIQYMEPPNARALGFDVASDPERWKTVEKARDTGMTTVHGPFRLIEEQSKSDAAFAVALYAPVYDEGDPGSEALRRVRLSGFMIAIFRVSTVLDRAAPSADLGLAYVMRDGDSPGAAVVAERPAGASKMARRSGFEITYPMACADRRWALDVFALPDAFVPTKRGAVAAAAIGVLAVLFGMVTVTALRTIARLRHQAEKVGPYRLVARLGYGAMGVVWEARHALLRRPTAVKLLAPGTEGERSLARFEREVQLTAALTHPSTIAIYDYGRTSDGVFYYAMELLRGINLLQLVAFDGPLPAARVVHLLRQACGALSEAHAAGLIHRDIKPANLMVCVYGGIPDFLKVLDFGLVKDIGAVEQVPDAEPARRGRRRPVPGRVAARHAALHGAGGDERPRRRRRAGRSLRARRGRLLPADRPIPLPGPDGDRGLRDGAPRAAGAPREGCERTRPAGPRGHDPPLPVVRSRTAARLGRGARRPARGLRRVAALEARATRGPGGRTAGKRPSRARPSTATSAPSAASF